ncbi:hypothetical protein C8Q75DRAFT_893793 [Abortiporus biennis]|nr:hypothetical protein C8Q75DRAFT_893793 [Abortiporus biennis]
MKCKSSLDKLPNELLTMIKEEIPESDLRTHTCFYNASSHFAALYGNEKNVERFFEKAYILSGLGISPDEDFTSISWVNLATRIIREDGFCDHPECGGNRLEKNAELMSRPEFESDEPYWSSLKIYGEEYDEFLGDDEDDEDYISLASDLVVNPLFQYVTFSEHSTKHWIDDDDAPEEESFLRYANRYGQGAVTTNLPRLDSHPIATRSFATFPPVRTTMLVFWEDISVDTPRNSFGLTVWDVVVQVHSILDETLKATSLSELLKNVDYREAFRPGCDLRDIIDAISNFRGFLSYFRWNGLDYDEWDRCPIIYMIYEVAKELPTAEEKKKKGFVLSP